MRDKNWLYLMHCDMSMVDGLIDFENPKEEELCTREDDQGGQYVGKNCIDDNADVLELFRKRARIFNQQTRPRFGKSMNLRGLEGSISRPAGSNI